MDNKKLIIIAAILVIIAAGVIALMLTSQDYERIYVTPNGTSIDAPLNETEYDGKYAGARIWHWRSGILVAYNSNEDNSLIKASERGFNAANDLIKHGEKQNIDNVTCYVINADELLKIQIFNVIKINYNGKFYCIPLSNETTHDNILICSKDQNIAVHMAQSVQYKNVFPDRNDLNDTISTIEDMAGNLSDKTNLTKVKSTVENKTGSYLEDAKNTIEDLPGKLLSN